MGAQRPSIERSRALVCRNIFGETSEWLYLGRFELIRTLGRGATGVVYEAFDPMYQERVALKTVRSGGASSTHRLKREFRSLVELSHPTLATLHELAVAGDEAYFTMELVDGKDFVSFVREGSPPGVRIADEDRLLNAFAQLCEGVQFLHVHDKLHRDIKPSNVLVTAAGRVVLLDFGLVHEIGEEFELGEGTPGYMAPEQARGEACKASDWYSVGVMLREAIHGKQGPLAVETPSLSLLERLAERLTDPEANRRPTFDEIAATIRAESSAAPRSSSREAAVFTGRSRELTRLQEAFSISRTRPIAVLVRGESGLGKSALLREFSRRHLVPAGAAVFSGRCYERESVPFKAFDTVIDDLCLRLLELPASGGAPLTQDDASAVLQLFPVLGRVHWLRARGSEKSHPILSREHGFAALRALFSGMSAQGPLVLCLDDLQWADTDSGSLLAALLCEIDSPNMLVILGDRTDDRLTSPAMEEFRSVAAVSERPLDVIDVHLEPLDESEATALVENELGAGSGGQFRSEIVREARGNPLFLIELARWSQDHSVDRENDALPSVENLFAERRARLTPSGGKILELLAAAGRPLHSSVVQRASGARAESLADLKVLRAARLVSTVRRGEGELFEVSHDRIAEGVLRGIDGARRVELHQALAESIEQLEGPGSEALIEQYLGAKMRAKAAECARHAADVALTGLAFSRAALLYERALSLGEPGSFDLAALYHDLAIALEHSGRGLDAAAAYVRAASETSDALVALGLEHRAVQLLMHSGRYKQGEALLSKGYRALGLKWPEGRVALLASIALLALPKAVRLKALALDPPSASVGRARVDYLSGAGRGIINFDPLRAVHNALVWSDQCDRLDDPALHARSLGARTETLVFVLPGGYDDGALGDLQKACALARDLGETRALADLERQRAFAHFFRAEPAPCLDAATLSEACFRASPLPDADIQPVMGLKVSALYVLGRLRDARRHSMGYCHEARYHQDLLSWTWVHGHLSRFPLFFAANERAEAEAVLERQAALRARHPDCVMLVWDNAASRIESAMYFGTALDAARALREEEHVLFGFQYKILHEIARLLRARVLIRAASKLPEGRRRARLLARAARDVAPTPRPGSDLQWGLSQLSRAAIHAQKGREDLAIAELTRAQSRISSAGAAVYLASADYCLGTLVGGEQGRELRAQGVRHLVSEGVKSPERYIAWFAPGFGVPESG
jgi:serine/threonine protein kinase